MVSFYRSLVHSISARSIRQMVGVALLAVGLFSLSGCSGVLKNLVCGNSGCSATSGTNDFLKSQILVSGTAVANGSDQLLVYVHLLNSDNTPVANFQPAYSVSSPDGVLPSQCFLSDNTGLSICIVKSTTTGEKNFVITNINTISLSKSLIFEPVPTTPVQAQLTSGGLQAQVAGAYSVSGSVGLVIDKPIQKVGAYAVYGSVEATVIPPSLESQ